MVLLVLQLALAALMPTLPPIHVQLVIAAVLIVAVPALVLALLVVESAI